MNAFRLLPSLALALCLMPCATAQAGAVHAELRADVRVEARTVTLGDIAALSGATEDELAALAGLRLASAPQPGYTLHLTRREVTRLLHEAGAPALDIDGADGTAVTAVSAALDMRPVVEAAQARLAAALQRDGLALDLAPIEEASALRLPLGAVTLRARDPEHREMRSRMTMRVDVLVDGSYYRTVPVAFTVHAMGQAFTARRDMAKGEVPACADLEAQQRDFAAFASAPLAGDCAAWQRRLKRRLAAGEVLLSGATEPLPVVSEGQYVTLKVAQGAVVIESRALALTDGELGQQITVRPSASEEPVLATVIGPGLVNLARR